jgi:hypothetical protein
MYIRGKVRGDMHGDPNETVTVPMDHSTDSFRLRDALILLEADARR